MQREVRQQRGKAANKVGIFVGGSRFNRRVGTVGLRKSQRADHTQVADTLCPIVGALGDGAAAADKTSDQLNAGVRDGRGLRSQLGASNCRASRGRLRRACIVAGLRFADDVAVASMGVT